MRLSISSMNSSTKTSKRVILDIRSEILSTSVSASWVGGIMCDSNLWGGKLVWRRLCMTSRAVSVSAQKKGGDSHHPIFRLFGATMQMLFVYASGILDGRA